MTPAEAIAKLRAMHDAAEHAKTMGIDAHVAADEAFRLGLMASLPALLAAVDAMSKLMRRTRELGDFYPDLDDAPEGAVPAWDLVALALNECDEVLAALAKAVEGA